MTTETIDGAAMWEAWRWEHRLDESVFASPGHSTWRAHARKVIGEVLRECGPDMPAVDVWKRVSEAYPFGEREHWPYKCWLVEVRFAKRQRGDA